MLTQAALARRLGVSRAWVCRALADRGQVFRGAVGHYLGHLGARDAAALFTNAGAADE
jgi:membrane protein YqaA with SNARE-associated domain